MIRSMTMIAVIAALLTGLCACSTREAAPEFTILLAESGEVILSDEHVAEYDASHHAIFLTPEGIERWKSFIPFDDSFDPPIPKLGRLTGKEFVVRIGDEEMYRGYFWSMVMSSMRKGVLIYDTLFPVDQLAVGFSPLGDEALDDPRGRPEIIGHFRDTGKLR